jgi:hypothetical protein
MIDDPFVPSWSLKAATMPPSTWSETRLFETKPRIHAEVATEYEASRRMQSSASARFRAWAAR